MYSTFSLKCFLSQFHLTGMDAFELLTFYFHKFPLTMFLIWSKHTRTETLKKQDGVIPGKESNRHLVQVVGNEPGQ
jgi:hypothetical protein